jgi:hypothetical protein
VNGARRDAATPISDASPDQPFAFPDQAVVADGRADSGPPAFTQCRSRVVSIDQCVKTNGGVEQCDGKDNDCNGIIDDIDVGADGIFDCDKIAIIGGPGSLAASSFSAWLKGTTNPANVVRIHAQATDAPTLTQEVLARYTLIILDRLQRVYDPAEAALLQRWIDAGCGLMVMTGHVAGPPSLDHPNSLISALGVRYAGSLESGDVTTFNAHPVTQGLTKAISFVGGYRVESDPGASTTIATLPSGSVAGVAVDRGEGKGRAIIWGDEWITYDSEWNNPSFDVPLFWSNIFRWVGRYQ